MSEVVRTEAVLTTVLYARCDGCGYEEQCPDECQRIGLYSAPLSWGRLITPDEQSRDICPNCLRLVKAELFRNGLTA